LTFEQRIVSELKDIRFVTLECRGCRARFSSLPTDPRSTVPEACPGGCGKRWWSPPDPGFTHRPPKALYSDFVELLREILKDPQAIGFRILLEFDHPSASPSSSASVSESRT
jgi:hypothetical protein